MSDTAAAQLKRILHLIPLCADDRSHSLDEMADVLGTTRETLLRDLRALSERFGDPGGFIEAVEVFVEPGHFSLRSDQFRRPMRLTLRELGALNLGLAILEAERPPDEQAVIERARTRLAQAIAALPDDDLHDELRHAAEGADADPEILRVVREGVRLDRRVGIRYTSANATAPGDRIICPLALVPSRGRWFVIGAVEEEVRVYRVDRMESAELLPETFDRSQAPAHEEMFSGERIFVGEASETLTVWYAPAIAAWIAEREEVTPAADGSVTVDHPLGDAEWAVRHVLQYGPDAEVVAPASVRAMVIDRLRQMTP